MTSRPRMSRKRAKKLDATTLLSISDEDVRREHKILQNLQRSLKSTAFGGGRRAVGFSDQTLYWQFRGDKYPLTNLDGSAYPSWRNLSPWMKAQIAGLVLQSRDCVAFTLSLHDELLEEVRARGDCVKSFIRNRIERSFRRRHRFVPWFLFVIENRTRSGKSHTAPHVHGIIEVRSLVKREDDRFRERIVRGRLELELGTHHTGLIFDIGETREVLRAAAGLEGRPVTYKGKSQARKVWCDCVRCPFDNADWISYAFKNAHLGSTLLPPNRLSMNRELNQEAQRLWRLITEGESALVQFPPDVVTRHSPVASTYRLRSKLYHQPLAHVAARVSPVFARYRAPRIWHHGPPLQRSRPA